MLRGRALREPGERAPLSRRTDRGLRRDGERGMVTRDARLEPARRTGTAALILSVLAFATAPAHALSDAEGRARFELLDSDGNGVVESAEYEARKVGVLFGRDRNAGGRLTPDEVQVPPDVLERFDTDGDGQLSGTELVLSRELRFTHADRDGDGGLKLEEFDALLAELTR